MPTKSCSMLLSEEESEGSNGERTVQNREDKVLSDAHSFDAGSSCREVVPESEEQDEGPNHDFDTFDNTLPEEELVEGTGECAFGQKRAFDGPSPTQVLLTSEVILEREMATDRETRLDEVSAMESCSSSRETH
ncbi:hypothetical protein Scep_005428 [Stephania cephalantha]|uniref:Uncharacterized protein n=1 Tax=Stephania cephalantha TaxID=152367 RepID=A0AAP0KVX4_9MAGN